MDDEYWGEDGTRPSQPKGVPSHISYFNCSLRLGQILAFALRTIYTINKSKVLLGFVGPQWEQHIVAELGTFRFALLLQLLTFVARFGHE